MCQTLRTGNTSGSGVNSNKLLGEDEKVKIPQVPEGGEEGGFVDVGEGTFRAEGTASAKALGCCGSWVWDDHCTEWSWPRTEL